jgi:hypothetical protein
MEYGESRGFGKRFLLSNKSKNNDLSVFTDFLTDAFALRKAMSSGKVPVPEADIDFSLNLRKNC